MHLFAFILYTPRLTQLSTCQQSEEHRHLDDMIKSGAEEGLRVIYTLNPLYSSICAYCSNM